MAQDVFRVGMGLADDNIFYISGTGAPAGDSGLTLEAPVGSYWSDSANGDTWKKVASAGVAGDWKKAADASEIAAVNAAIAAEVARATAAEGVLQSAINSEAARATAAEGVLTAAVAQEASDRAAADATETAARIAGDAAQATALATEVTDRTAADAALQAQINSLSTGSTTALDAEIARAIAAEAALQTALTAEAAARAAADTTLTTNLAAEVTRATAAEGVLTTAIADEATRALAAEAALQTALTNAVAAEATARQAADAAEASARAAADTALQAEVDAVEVAAGLNADGTLPALTGTYVAGKTSLKAAVEALDVAAQGQAASLAQEITDRTAADLVEATARAAADTTEAGLRAAGDASLQAELDATQAAAGLNADGSFTAPAGTNYLGTAVGLKDSDVKLDAQIKAARDEFAAAISALTGGGNGSLAAMQAEIDATQTGAGLAADGSYVPDLSTNYISAASSLNNADKLLDSQIKILATALASLDSINTTVDQQQSVDILAEQAARIAGDSSLQASITAEVAARIAADTAEVTARTAADAALQAAIDALGTSSSAAVAAEAARATAAEAALSAEDAAIRAFIGKNAAGAETPSYSSTYVVANGDDLEAAIGKLDAKDAAQDGRLTAVEAIAAASATTSSANNVTTSTVVDSVDSGVAGLAKWLVYVSKVGGTERQAIEVLAATNGVTADFTSYAKLRLGAIQGLTVAVAFNAGQMQLVVNSSVPVNVKAVREVVVA